MTSKLSCSSFNVLLSKGSSNAISRCSFPFLNHTKWLSTFDDIPKAPHMPVLGSMPYFIKAGGQSQLHMYADNIHKKLGPMFVDKLVGNEMLFISDPEVHLEVYRSEGRYPEHFVLDAWKLFLQESEHKRGLFFMDGEEWHKNRLILNKILLIGERVEPHVNQISSVCKDFIQIWKSNPPKEQLEYHLYSWNIECIGEIAFGKRLGFLDKLKSENASQASIKSAKEDEFVKSIHDTFLESANLYIWPAKLAQRLEIGAWKRFVSAVTKSLVMGRAYVQSGIEDCKTNNSSEEVRRSILYRLLKEEKLTEDDASNLLVDLFLASADTTAHTACWALYLLGRNPLVAQKARQEIKEILKNSQGNITFEELNSLSYVNGIIRETLRMYPIAIFLTRKLGRDADLSGYFVPKGTLVISSMYSMGRDPTNYEDPNSFRPERWFRSSPITQCPGINPSHSFKGHTNRRAFTPWGVGGRSCVGRKVAELELSSLIVEALLAFDWTVDEDIDLVLKMVPVPSQNIVLNLSKI